MKKLFKTSRATDGDAAGANGEELKPLTQDADRKHGRERSPTSVGGASSLAGSLDGKGKYVTYGRTLLHKAARKGNVDEVRRLLSTIRASAVDDNGSTALHDAVLGSDDLKAAVVLKELCSKCDEACVNSKNLVGRTALHIASLMGLVEAAEVLLKHGAKINEDDREKNTSLHLAALCVNRENAVRLVTTMCQLDDGAAAEVNERNGRGQTALHLAATAGNADVVRLLLSHGASRTVEDDDERTALHAAALCPDDTGGAYVVRELCKDAPLKSANLRVRDNHNEQESDDDSDSDDDDFVNRKNYEGKTALHLATGSGKLRMVQKLLQYGAKRGAVDQDGRTALHYVSYVKCNDEREANVVESIVRELITTAKRNPDSLGAFVDRQDNKEKTALHRAAYHGQLRAVQTLLSCKADVKVKDQQGCTPLLAAANAKDVDELSSMMEALCDAGAEYKWLVNQQDVDGRTALHVVASRGHLSAVKTLLDRGAATDLQDNDDNAVIHTALLAPDTTNTAGIVSAICASDQARADKSFIKQHGAQRKTALHLAAGKGLVRVVDILLVAGAKLDVTDQEGWTPLHDAITYDGSDVEATATIVRKFCSSMSHDKSFIDRQNIDGETALHMAARFGHQRAVTTLLEFTPHLEIQDNDGWIPLHSAVKVEPEIVRAIIDAIKTSKQNASETKTKPSLKQIGKLVAKGTPKKPGSLSAGGLLTLQDVTKQMMITRSINKVLNTVNYEGRTPLHLAALMNSADMIRELKSLDPEIRDISGLSPLHVAAKMPHSSALRAMLDVFYSRSRAGTSHEYRLYNVNHVNGAGDSALHICCVEGDADKVRMMLQSGADLEKRSRKSYTLLHRLVRIYMHEPALQENMINIYRQVVALAVHWKCQKDRRVLPKTNSELYNANLREMMLYLTCELKVKGLNVLQYASKKGATKLLDEILRTPYVFMNPVTEQFDVTFLIPDTVPELTSGGRAGRQKPLSCLEWIVNNRQEDKAEDVLAVYPFCELVNNYWVLCRRVYNVFLVIHIVFMTLFSVYAMPTTEFIITRFDLPVNDSTSFDGSSAFRPETVPLYGLFLLWPVIICFVELVDIIEFCCRAYSEAARSGHRKKKSDEEEEEEAVPTCERLRKLLSMGRILMFGFHYLSNISALSFSSSVIAWYVLYKNGTDLHYYCEAAAAVFIFGWMHTITYVKLFKDWHAFASIFKQIVAKDVTKFAYIFIFVLLSFSFAIHALSKSIYPLVAMHTRTLAETVYLTFCLTVTVTVGGLVDISTDADYEQAGGNIHLLQMVFAAYLCLSTIIMLNMLIAMMNSTYSLVSSTRASTWRVESLRTALWFERKMPLLKSSVFLRFKTYRRVVDDRPRWYIDYTPEQTKMTTPLETLVDEEDKVLKCVREMKSDLADLRHNRSSTANQSLGDIQSQLSKFEEEHNVAKEKLEAQTQVTIQLQQQMLRIEQLCLKLNEDLNALATKA